MKLKLTMLLAAASTLLGVGMSRADTIIYQSQSNFNTQLFVNCSSCGGTYSTFDFFSLPAISLFDPRGRAWDISAVQFGEYGGSPYYPISSVTLNIFTFGERTPIFSQTFSADEVTTTAYLPANYPNGAWQDIALVKLAPTGLSLDPGNYLISFYGEHIGPATYYGGSGFVTNTSGVDDPLAPRVYVANDFHIGFILETVDPIATPVPEPGALALFGTGLSALGLLGWRRRRKGQAAAAAELGAI
jgi:PEP-CTERM motif